MAAASVKQSIPVKITTVINPVTYVAIVHRKPDDSARFRTLEQLEKELNDYYNTFKEDPLTISDIITGSEIVVRHPLNRRWYRAKKTSAIESRTGLRIQVILIDYGDELSVGQESARQIKEEFLDFPCQCTQLALPGLLPVSLSLGPDVKLRYAIQDKWDSSAVSHVNTRIKQSSSTRIEILGSTEDSVDQVLLYVTVNDVEICLNDELVKRRFATLHCSKFREAVSTAPPEVSDCDASLPEQLEQLRADLSRKIQDANFDSASDVSFSNRSTSPLVLPSQLVDGSTYKASAHLSLNQVGRSSQRLSGGTTSSASSSSDHHVLQPLRLPRTNPIFVSPPGSSASTVSSAAMSVRSTDSSRMPLIGRGRALIKEIPSSSASIVEASSISPMAGLAEAAHPVVSPVALPRSSPQPSSVGLGRGMPVVASPSSSPLSSPQPLVAGLGRAPLVGASTSSLRSPPQPAVVGLSRGAPATVTPPQPLVFGRGRAAPVAVFPSASPLPLAVNLGRATPLAGPSSLSSPPQPSIGGVYRGAPVTGAPLQPLAVGHSRAPPSASPLSPPQPLGVGRGRWGPVAVAPSPSPLLSLPPPIAVPANVDAAASTSAPAVVSRAQRIMMAMNKVHPPTAGQPVSPPRVKIADVVSPKIAQDQVKRVDESLFTNDNAISSLDFKPILQAANKPNMVMTLDKPFAESLNVASETIPAIDASVLMTKTRKPVEVTPSDEPHRLQAAHDSQLSVSATECLQAMKSEPAMGSWRRRSGEETSINQSATVPWRQESRDGSSSGDSCGDVFRNGDGYHERTPGTSRGDPTMLVSRRYHVVPEQNFLFSTSMDDPLGIVGGGISTVKILVSGSVPPKLSVTNMATMFESPIIDRLPSLGIHAPSWIQSIIWPAISRGRNITVISEAQSGKTYSYLLPLFMALIKNNAFDNVPSGNEPLSIILCPSWLTVVHVHEQCLRILNAVRIQSVRVIKVHGGDSNDKLVYELMQGCEVLVITPSALLRLMSGKSIKLTGMARLCYFILEDVDELLDKFGTEMTTINNVFNRTMTQRTRKDQSDIHKQVMAFGRKWSPKLSAFVKEMMPTPLFFCSSFFEAIICCGVDLVPTMVKCKEQLATLLELVKDRLEINRHKFVIFVSDSATGAEVYNALSSRCSYVLFAHHNMLPGEISAVQLRWDAKTHPDDEQPVLVLTDRTLDEMHVVDAAWLIHYDIPVAKKSLFGRRFSCMLQRMSDAVKDITSPKRANCSSVVIITEKSRQQARTLYLLLRRLKIDVPDRLVDFMSDYYRDKEEKRAGVPLCFYWKSFGSCPNDLCCERHLLLKSDAPQPDLVRGGHVHVVITAVRNASNYHGRVTGYRGVDPTWLDRNERHRILTTTMHMHYSSRDHCVPHGAPSDGDLCAVREDDNLYRRVRVLQLLLQGDGPESARSLRKVRVHFIDEGRTGIVKLSSLLKLPEDVLEIPPLSFEIILCYVKPADKDREWTLDATSFVDKLIPGEELTGKIVLSLGNTLWLSPLVKHTRLRPENITIIDFDVKQRLLEKNLALPNPNHMDKIISSCESFFNLPPSIEVERKEEVAQAVDPAEQMEVAFAFLPMQRNGESLEMVDVATIYSPDRFYVQRAEKVHFKGLDKLMDDLDDHVKKGQPRPLAHVKVGAYCIAIFPPDGNYYRGQIETIIQTRSDTMVEDLVIFYVDYGETDTVSRDCVYPLPPKFVWRLPFQAIECSLSGVFPLPDQEWSVECVEMMRDFTKRREDSCLFAEVLKKRPIGTDGLRFRYEVEIKDLDDTNLADELCMFGYCKEPNPTLSEPELPDDAHDDRSASGEDDGGQLNGVACRSTVRDYPNKVFIYEVDNLPPVLPYVPLPIFSIDPLPVLPPDLPLLLDDPVKIVSNEIVLDPVLLEEPVAMVADVLDPLLLEDTVETVSAVATAHDNVVEDLPNLLLEVPVDASAVNTSLPTGSPVGCFDDRKVKYLSSVVNVGAVGGAESIPSTSKCENKCAGERRKKKKPTRPERKKSKSRTHPPVQWSQTPESITLKLMIRGVKNDYLSTEGGRLTYITIVSEKRYELDEQLFAAVDATKTTSSTSETLVTIKIAKVEFEKWPRLLKTRTKQPWLSVDFDKIGQSCPNSDEEICWDACDNPVTVTRGYRQPAGIEESTSSSSDSSSSEYGEGFDDTRMDYYEPFGK